MNYTLAISVIIALGVAVAGINIFHAVESSKVEMTEMQQIKSGEIFEKAIETCASRLVNKIEVTEEYFLVECGTTTPQNQ